MGLGTIYLLCFAGVVLFLISGDRVVRHPNNSLIDYLDSSCSHALSCINRRALLLSVFVAWTVSKHRNGKLTPRLHPTQCIQATQHCMHGVCVGECFFVFTLCGFSLSLFCNYCIACIVSPHGLSYTPSIY